MELDAGAVMAAFTHDDRAAVVGVIRSGVGMAVVVVIIEVARVFFVNADGADVAAGEEEAGGCEEDGRKEEFHVVTPLVRVVTVVWTN
jgi:hypothetical protein